MKQKSNQLVFFGTEKFSATVLEKLIKAGFLFEAVITKPDSRKGRGHKMTAPLVKTIALKHQIKVLQPENKQQLIDVTKSLKSNAAVLVSYGKIIPQPVLDHFDIGIINLHPSLLPKYRGPSPIETAIANGDQTTGVSLIKLVAAMDAGPIYAQAKYSLDKQTASQVYQDLAILGANLMIESLPKILSGDLLATEQNSQQATYCKLLTKEQGYLKPEFFTAVELECQIRAYQIFPRSRYQFENHNCIILEATTNTKPSELAIKAKDGKYLNILKLISPNGKIVDSKSFVNGYLK